MKIGFGLFTASKVKDSLKPKYAALGFINEFYILFRTFLF